MDASADVAKAAELLNDQGDAVKKTRKKQALRLMAIRQARLEPLASSASGHEIGQRVSGIGWVGTD